MSAYGQYDKEEEIFADLLEIVLFNYTKRSWALAKHFAHRHPICSISMILPHLQTSK